VEKGEKRALPLKKQNRVRDDIGEEGFLFPYQSKMMHHHNRAGTAGFSLGLVLYAAIERVVAHSEAVCK
jgi:hypothetical protein